MNKLFLSLFGLAILLSSFNYNHKGKVESFHSGKLYSSGGIVNATGAPTENNCTYCHSGSVLSGAAENNLVVTTGFLQVSSYVPGQTYNMALQMNSNPAKKGFAATVLDAFGTKAGTLIGVAVPGGTQSYVGGAREYVSHKAASNNDTYPTWSWQWTAPATDMGDLIIYVATNAANGDNGTSGDLIYLSQYALTVDNSSASVTEIEDANEGFTAGYSIETNSIIIDAISSSTGPIEVNVVSLEGKIVKSVSLGEAIIGENHHSVCLPSSLDDGIYVVHYLIGNNARSTKVMISNK